MFRRFKDRRRNRASKWISGKDKSSDQAGNTSRRTWACQKRLTGGCVRGSSAQGMREQPRLQSIRGTREPILRFPAMPNAQAPDKLNAYIEVETDAD
jgi:hypothetical protein